MRTRILLLLFFACLCVTPFGGVHAQDGQQQPAVQVSIERPGEGETFYAGPASLLFSITITGWAFSSNFDPSDIVVQLEIIQAPESVGRLETRPRADGSFFFSVTANPHGLPLNTPDPTCLHCHYASALSLPSGPMLLRAIAHDPQGNTAVSERHIVMDRSGKAIIPVEVRPESTENPIPSGLPVTAAGWLYEWRARYGTGRLNQNGEVDVEVEALSETPTTYVLSIVPTIRNGVTYESVEPVEVAIPPGATVVEPVTLRVRSHAGRLSGTITPAPPEPLILQAIRKPNGSMYSTTVNRDGTFQFSELPIGSYLLSVAPDELIRLDMRAERKNVDLANSPTMTTTLALAPAWPRELEVIVDTEDGSWVPFAWITVTRLERVQRTALESGAVLLNDLPSEKLSLMVTAPGFYSQAHVADVSAESLSVQLLENPALRRLSWGEGELIIPPETMYAVEQERIALIRGWIWGTGRNDHVRPITVDTITIHKADGWFALEAIPGQGRWLYVLEGTATVSRDGEAPISVGVGEMMALLDEGQLTPVPLDITIAELLGMEGADTSPPPVWQPTVTAQMRDRLARAGVTIAQLMTFITYIIILLSLLAIPFAAVYLRRRQKSRDLHDVFRKEMSSQ